LGQVIGDSLGGIVEFISPERIRERFPGGLVDLGESLVWGTAPGQPTDDSELALALARTLIAHRGWIAGPVFAAYERWIRSAPFDAGNTTRQALAHGVPFPDSQANGSLMRCSPLGILYWDDPATAAEFARKDSALTHPHPICQDACAVYVASIARGIGGGSTETMIEQAIQDARTDEVRERLTLARTAPPGDFTHQQGWVLTALQNAFYRLVHGSFERGLIDTVHSGGDTDTNAAIAGALLGSLHGRVSIPERWVRVILACRLDAPGLRHPRPRDYWPVDALELAAQLAGRSP
jgi:ADP-ribosylglycohydrolase